MAESQSENKTECQVVSEQTDNVKKPKLPNLESSKVENISDRLGKMNTDDGDSSSAAIPNLSSSQIEADMLQIDSILKALNSGTFDQSNMLTIDQLTAQKPKVRTIVFPHWHVFKQILSN